MFIHDDEKSYYRRYYKALEGATITSAGLTVDGFPFFNVKLASGQKTICELSEDPEGNGPGFLFGLPENC